MDLLNFWAAWWWVVIGIWGSTWIVLGYGVSIRQDRATLGALLGLLLGPLGVAVMYTLGVSEAVERERRVAQMAADQEFAAEQARRKRQ